MSLSTDASHIHQILVIEYDPSGTRAVRTELDGWSDLRAHYLNDVVNAFRFLSRRDHFADAPTPDLILLSLELPYFSGTALLQERRRRASWRTIPVVVVSDRTEDSLPCLALGADHHVVRPKKSNEWRRIIHDLRQRYLPLATPP